MPITDDFRRQLGRRVYFTSTAGIPRTIDLLVADVDAYVAARVAEERARLHTLLTDVAAALRPRLLVDHPLIAAIEDELACKDSA